MSLISPSKSLWRLNLIMAISLSLIDFLFLYIGIGNKPKTYYFSGQLAVMLFGIGACHILIFNYNSSRGQLTSRSYKLQRYLLSHFYSAGILLVSWAALFSISNIKIPFDFKLVLFIIAGIVLANSLILVFQDYIILLHRKAQTEIENLQLKGAVSEASLLVLKQQIHPHFLFNSLNTLKVLYEVNPEQGETYLVHLANYLRAAISENEKSISTLAAELQLCHDYMEMQRIRFGEALNYQVNINQNKALKAQLPFFSLQPLLENAIKHNELTEASPLTIHVDLLGDWIAVSNNIQPKRHKEFSTGQGLMNLAQRYKLWNGEEIKVEEMGKTFSVSIKLQHQHGDSNHRG